MSSGGYPPADRWYAYSSGRPLTAGGHSVGAREAFNDGWRWGARETIRETARLSPYINQFLHMLVLIGYADETYATLVDTAGNRTRSFTAHHRQCDVRTLRQRLHLRAKACRSAHAVQ